MKIEERGGWVVNSDGVVLKVQKSAFEREIQTPDILCTYSAIFLHYQGIAAILPNY